MALRPESACDAPAGLIGGDERDTLQRLAQREEAMTTEGLSDLKRHALGTLNASCPLHPCRPAEKGKTTLALRMSAQHKQLAA